MVILNLFFLFDFQLLVAQEVLNIDSTYRQRGQASYYHSKFEGRKTASGELFSNLNYTAAHRTLAFGTILKVVNPKDSSFTYVKVNDRGPYSKKFIIDLSKKAAESIGLTKAKGHIEVTIHTLVDTTGLNFNFQPHTPQPRLKKPKKKKN